MQLLNRVKVALKKRRAPKNKARQPLRTKLRRPPKNKAEEG
jgi:hypothetical protein